MYRYWAGTKPAVQHSSNELCLNASCLETYKNLQKYTRTSTWVGLTYARLQMNLAEAQNTRDVAKRKEQRSLVGGVESMQYHS